MLIDHFSQFQAHITLLLDHCLHNTPDSHLAQTCGRGPSALNFLCALAATSNDKVVCSVFQTTELTHLCHLKLEFTRASPHQASKFLSGKHAVLYSMFGQLLSQLNQLQFDLQRSAFEQQELRSSLDTQR